jgi:DNA-binding NarL/FixJ family response regulator
MTRPNFLSAEDRRELLACVKRQREDHGVARRANALLLLDDGKSCAEIAEVLYLDDDTIRGGTGNIWPRAGTRLPVTVGRAGSLV